MPFDSLQAIDARGRGIAYALDANSYLLSVIRITPAMFQARDDLVLVTPPEPVDGARLRWVSGAWVNEAFTPSPPPATTATWADIRTWRDRHEVAPITTSFGTFDCDPRSEARMVGSIEQFEQLPTLDADGKLTWKRADNSTIALTRIELETIYAEVKRYRAQRGAVLHVRAEQFNAQDPGPTPEQLADLTYWNPA